MKNRFSVFLIFSILLILPEFSCTDSGFDGPSISWQSQTTYTYSYSGGVLSGVNIYAKFTVIEGEGEVMVEASLAGESQSVSIQVELDSIYTVKAICNISSSGGNNLNLSSPSADKDFNYSFSDTKMKLSDLSAY